METLDFEALKTGILAALRICVPFYCVCPSHADLDRPSSLSRSHHFVTDEKIRVRVEAFIHPHNLTILCIPAWGGAHGEYRYQAVFVTDDCFWASLFQNRKNEKENTNT